MADRRLTENQLDALRAIQKGGDHGVKGVRLTALQDRGLVVSRGVPRLTKAGTKALAQA